MPKQMLEMTPDNLRALRAEFGLSQGELAELVHMSGFTRISDWERGRHPINAACWELLLIKLGRHREFGPLTLGKR